MGVTPSAKAVNIQTKGGKDKKYLLVCPTCEQEGKDGYYMGFNANKRMERITCLLHKELPETTI